MGTTPTLTPWLEGKWAVPYSSPVLLLAILKFLLLEPEFSVENRDAMDKPKEVNWHLGGLFQMSAVLF